jgi:hypothetical protein
MSRGPGRVERALVAAVAASPRHAITIEEACNQLYPLAQGSSPKKHRAAVTRAGKKAARRGENIGHTSYRGPGRTAAFYAADEVEAYAHANLKAMGWGHDDASRQSHIKTTFKKHLEPGGRWWLDVQLFIAERDGDPDRAAEHRRAIDRYEEGHRKTLAGLGDGK